MPPYVFTLLWDTPERLSLRFRQCVILKIISVYKYYQYAPHFLWLILNRGVLLSASYANGCIQSISKVVCLTTVIITIASARFLFIHNTNHWVFPNIFFMMKCQGFFLYNCWWMITVKANNFPPTIYNIYLFPVSMDPSKSNSFICSTFAHYKTHKKHGINCSMDTKHAICND